MSTSVNFEGFTPGPWTAEALVFAATGELSGKWQISARATAGELILVAHVAGGGEAKEPNARLIASAPDLLAEVERLRAEVDRLKASDHVLVHAVNQRTIESRRWSSLAVERKAEVGHLREANAQLEEQRDTLAKALIRARGLLAMILGKHNGRWYVAADVLPGTELPAGPVFADIDEALRKADR